MLEQIEDRINEIHESVNQSIEVNEQLESIEEQYGDNEELEDLSESIDQLKQDIADWQAPVIELRQKGFQDVLNWPAGINSEFFFLRNNLDTYDPTIPGGYKDRLGDLENSWSEMKADYQELIDEKVKAFNALFKSKDLPVLSVPPNDQLSN